MLTKPPGQQYPWRNTNASLFCLASAAHNHHRIATKSKLHIASTHITNSYLRAFAESSQRFDSNLTAGDCVGLTRPSANWLITAIRRLTNITCYYLSQCSTEYYSFSVQVLYQRALLCCEWGMGAFLENSSGADAANVYNFIVLFLVEARYL